MWFASIWIFTLRLPWQLGADVFLRNLLDGDPASNTLSWRWVAGLQTRGKTYQATADNIARFTDGRYRPRGLATTAEPLDGPPPPPAGAAPEQRPLTRGRAHDVGRIVTAYAPTGYAADALDRARAEAAGDGIVIETVLRGWDARAWPHATRGFFPFTERIPGLVRDAGIGA
ncbi:deoxyribodipyrimidine photo-lyase [Microcella alkaliphila]|uniref:Deoxyribodipyrimidine photo-lyase n=2 Tax=Microcella alkaliphila TaxID=279828 RepID=A0A0U4WVG8_9MICO|nr:deoxyribodipyrimidine photo-lyase [Microcella alkaliphila]